MSNLEYECENLKQAYRYLRRVNLYDKGVIDLYERKMKLLVEQNSDYLWQQLIEIQDKYDNIEKKLPNASDEEFEEYIYLGDLLAVIKNVV